MAVLLKMDIEFDITKSLIYQILWFPWLHDLMISLIKGTRRIWIMKNFKGIDSSLLKFNKWLLVCESCFITKEIGSKKGDKIFWFSKIFALRKQTCFKVRRNKVWHGKTTRKQTNAIKGRHSDIFTKTLQKQHRLWRHTRWQTVTKEFTTLRSFHDATNSVLMT